MIFVDAHVHIYDCFDIDFLFDSALHNFQEWAGRYADADEAATFVLFLPTGRVEKRLGKLLQRLENPAASRGEIASRWEYTSIPGSGMMTVFRRESRDEMIHLVAGRQIVTKENIEVLALYCRNGIDDGLTMVETLDGIRQQDGIPVLPWGVGKWFGKRGALIRKTLQKQQGNMYLGDNGGRPGFWPTPTLFGVARKFGVAVLPGSDPLPLPREASRVGSYGFCLPEKNEKRDSSVSYLRKMLKSGNPPVTPYGRRQGNLSFVINQIRLRFFPYGPPRDRQDEA